MAICIGVNLQTSYLTPPFGFSLFFLRGVAPPEVRTADIYRGVVRRSSCLQLDGSGAHHRLPELVFAPLRFFR